MAALVALIASALAAALAPSADAATKTRAPVITSAAPNHVAVGEVLTIKGRHFLRGRSRNTVVFKRDGARAVFAKAGISTRKMMQVRVPGSLQEFFALNAGEPVPTLFRVRVLARKFGKAFTSDALSPIIFAPRSAGPGTPGAALPGGGAPTVETPRPSPADGDCDGDGSKNKADSDDDNDGLIDDVEVSLSLDPCVADTDKDGLLDKWEFDCDRDGVLNRDQADDDSDLLDDATETRIGTNPCAIDSDGDGVEDGYEYQSARDLNDDEYQEPQSILPAPEKREYPNPLFADAGEDYDGDSLQLGQEFALWKAYRNPAAGLTDLVYSDGNQYSAYGRDDSGRRPGGLIGPDPRAKYDDFFNWLPGRYSPVWLERGQGISGDSEAPAFFDLRDFDQSAGALSLWEEHYFDFDGDDKLSDDERDEDADGLTNYDEAVGRNTSAYWTACYKGEKPYRFTYAGTNLVDPDSDGDGVRDGADDQDHDDVPNLMELSRADAAYPRVVDPKARCGKDAGVAEALPVHGRVNPFNPCLPYIDSRTCDRHPAIGNPYAPFDDSPNYLILN
jgi:hypothetical protein